MGEKRPEGPKVEGVFKKVDNVSFEIMGRRFIIEEEYVSIDPNPSDEKGDLITFPRETWVIIVRLAAECARLLDSYREVAEEKAEAERVE